MKKDKTFKNEGINLDKFNIEKNNLRFPVIYRTLPKEKRVQFKNILRNSLKKENDSQLYYLTIRAKILNTKAIKDKYKQTIKDVLFLKNDSKIEMKYYEFRILQFYDLVYKGIIEIDEFNINEIGQDKFKFLHDPENFDKNLFDVNWLLIFNWRSFCKRFANSEYIITAIEKELIKKHNDTLSKIYFNIKSFIYN